MRSLATLKRLSAASLLALFAGCSNGSSIAPDISSAAHGRVTHSTARIPSALNLISRRKLQQVDTVHRVAGFNNCPARGTIEYVSDAEFNMIYIFVGNWRNDFPCGTLTAGLSGPWGLTVHAHNLYVANSVQGNVLVFHRGATTAFMTYSDHTGGITHYPQDVTVAPDNTIIATNVGNSHDATGSISTWRPGGHLVGNFPSTPGIENFYVTVQKSGKVYYDDSTDTVYVGRCPLGACGTFVNTGATGISYAGQLRSLSYVKTGFDVAVLLNDEGNGVLDTFKSFPGPPSSSCHWPQVTTPEAGFDINYTNHHIYGAVPDTDFSTGIEMTYPGCVFIGFAGPNNTSSMTGLAIDRPGALE
jgi:hypothetical protein